MTYSNVVASLALFTAMSGTAYAAVVITGKDVKDGSLRSVDIADGLKGVQSRDVRNGSLGTIDLSAAARAALKGNAGATGAAGPAGASGATGPAGANGASATSLWAVVASNGRLMGGSGVVSAGFYGGGGYVVAFNRNVTGCAYQATLGSLDDYEVGGFATTSTASAFGPESVGVYTRNAASSVTARSFHLSVFC